MGRRFQGPGLIPISNQGLAGPGIVRREEESRVSINLMRGRSGDGQTHATTKMNVTIVVR